MKDDFSQDEKNFSKMNQTENSSFVNDDSLDWAKQVYLQLKQKQKEEKELSQKEIEAQEILNTKTNIKEDFKIFLNNYEFNPHNLFICKKHSLIKQYYEDVFKWLFECEEKFQYLKLDTFRKKRIYGFLAERYLPYWFKKNTKTLDWPYIFFDTNRLS